MNKSEVGLRIAILKARIEAYKSYRNQNVCIQALTVGDEAELLILEEAHKLMV